MIGIRDVAVVEGIECHVVYLNDDEGYRAARIAVSDAPDLPVLLRVPAWQAAIRRLLKRQPPASQDPSAANGTAPPLITRAMIDVESTAL